MRLYLQAIDTLEAERFADALQATAMAFRSEGQRIDELLAKLRSGDGNARH